MIDRLRPYSIELFLVGLLLIAVLFFGYLGLGLLPRELEETFSSSRALGYVEEQVEFGPRVAGSEAALQTSDWLVDRLTNAGWNVAILPFPLAITNDAGETVDATARNLMSVRPSASGALPGNNVTWVATYYDTLAGDGEGSPGAVAGASGAAVLVELARSLDLSDTGQTVCFALLEAGRSPASAGVIGLDYLLRSFEGAVPEIVEPCRGPRAVVVLDAVGGQMPSLAEGGDGAINAALQQAAAATGNELSTTVLSPADAGAGPLAEVGVPVAILSTGAPPPQSDTLDRVKIATLERVGRVLQVWLEAGAPF